VKQARVVVFDYGMGNIRSVSRACAKAGGDVRVVTDPGDFDPSLTDGLVLPGQGHFGACVQRLRTVGLDQAVLDWVQEDRPFLGICVGMQILAEWSEEDSAPGLGVLPGRCVRVGGPGLTVPHMGWDCQTWPVQTRLFAGTAPGTRFYYCHSYGLSPGLGHGVEETVSSYGVPFLAALERSNLWATQFHPEKSSADGLVLWENFLASCLAARSSPPVSGARVSEREA